jgi:hypothetical protein
VEDAIKEAGDVDNVIQNAINRRRDADTALAMNYAYFGYRCLEIWQRLIRFTYASPDFDVATRSYARLAKSVSATPLQMDMRVIAPASHVVCNALFHLAQDRPPVASKLLEKVAEDVFQVALVMRWCKGNDGQATPLASFIVRFQELADAFNPAIACLHASSVAEDGVMFDDQLVFVQKVGHLLSEELAVAVR